MVVRLTKLHFAVIFVLACGLAKAQTGRGFPTVEAIVGTSEQVYSGWIESATPSPDKPAVNLQTFHLNVQVVDTFRGHARQSIELDMTTYLPSSLLQQFCEKREMFLWVSTPKERLLGYNLASKMGLQGSEPGFLWFRLYDPDSVKRYVDYDSNVFTSDLRVISSWDDLRKEVQRYLKKHHEVVQTIG